MHMKSHQNVEPIIIGGCGRSGTTLMRVMLDSHPDVCCGPESDLFDPKFRQLNEVSDELWSKLAWKFDIDINEIRRILKRSFTHGEFVKLFFLEYVARTGKRRWAEKTPRNVHMLDYVFETFPNAKFIHVVRDGRDVVCSLRTHPRHKVVNGELVPTGIVNPINECLRRWVNDVSAGLKYRGHPRYIEIRYEDLVIHPETTTRKLFEFLEINWIKDVINFHQVKTSSRDVTKFPQNPEASQPLQDNAIGRWKEDLTPSELAFIEQNDNGLLALLGYR